MKEEQQLFNSLKEIHNDNAKAVIEVLGYEYIEALEKLGFCEKGWEIKLTIFGFCQNR
jgi:iron-sulfur cluster repair protein YtfE (RIC family)